MVVCKLAGVPWQGLSTNAPGHTRVATHSTLTIARVEIIVQLAVQLLMSLAIAYFAVHFGQSSVMLSFAMGVISSRVTSSLGRPRATARIALSVPRPNPARAPQGGGETGFHRFQLSQLEAPSLAPPRRPRRRPFGPPRRASRTRTRARVAAQVAARVASACRGAPSADPTGGLGRQSCLDSFPGRSRRSVSHATAAGVVIFGAMLAVTFAWCSMSRLTSIM